MKRLYYLIFILATLSVFSGCSADYSDVDEMYIPEDEYNGENYTDYGENPFESAADKPVSTFSIDADGGSYSNMRRYINSGQLPPSDAVRIEEFINFFTFDYDNPETEAVTINSESAVCPWNNEHFLLRIGLKGKSLETRPPSNFVFLIDVSGSMDSDDKLGILKAGFKTFTDQLTEDDRVAIVTYAGSDAVLLNSTPGNQHSRIKEAIDKLGAGGSTAGAQGIISAYQIAQQNFIDGGNNRVVLGTDGDFNVGPSSTEELKKLIEEQRESGVYLTVLAVGTGNLNDAGMEQLADNGNGTYEYIDSQEQIEKIFIYEYDKFYTVATDSKIQITFDSLVVESYRLIGYENRVLEDSDFENDSTDAGEIGAGQTITALYEIVPRSGANTETFGNLEFRYKPDFGEQSILIAHVMKHEPSAFENSSENMRFCSALASFGMILKKSQFVGSTSFDFIKNTADNARSFDPQGYRNEFVTLVDKASRLRPNK